MVQDDCPWPTFGTARLGAGALSMTPAVFTAQGRLLVSAVGRTVQVYRTESGLSLNSAATTTGLGRWTLQRRLQAHEDRVTSIAVLDPSNIFRAISASLDGTLRLWDLEEGSLLRTIDLGVPILRCVIGGDQERYGYMLCCSPGCLLPSRGDDSTCDPAEVTALEEELPAERLRTDGTLTTSSETSGQSRRANGRSCFIARVNLYHGRWKTLFHMPYAWVCMDLSADGRLLAATSEQQVYLWRSDAPGDVCRWEHSGATITAVSIDGIHERVAVGDARGLITVYHVQSLLTGGTRQERKTGLQTAPFSQRWHWHARPVRALLFRARGMVLLSGGHEGVLVEWHRVQTGDQSTHRRFYPRLGGVIEAMAFDEETQTCALTLSHGCLTLLHLPSYTNLGCLRTLVPLGGPRFGIPRVRPSRAPRVTKFNEVSPSGRLEVSASSPMRLFALTSCGSAQTLVLVYTSPDGAICFHSVARDTCIGVLKWRESPPLCFVQDRSSEQVVFAIDERGRYMVTVDEEIPLRERWPAQPMDERTNRQITLCFWSRSIALEQDEAALTSTPAMSVSATVTLAHRDRLVLLAMRQADVFTLDESGAFYRWSWSKQPDGTNRAKEQTPSRPIYCAATTRLRSRTPFVRAVLSTDASVLVTVSRDGAVSVFALGESIRLLQMVHLLHLIDETVDLGQMNVSGVSKVSLDALDIVESGQLVLSVHGERMPSQLVVYDMRQERVLWRLPLAVQHLAALRPSATLKEAVASLDTPLDAFAAAIPAAQAVLIFRCLGEPVPVALWKLPLGSRPSVILTHPLVPLALVDEDAHLHIPSGPLGAPELTSTNAEQCDPCQRNRLSFWHEALPPAWYEQLPMPTPVDRKERPWSPTMYERSLEAEEVPAFTPVEPFLDTLFAQFADASRHRTLDNDQTRPTVEALSRPNESVVVTSSTSKEIASISSETFVEPREWATVLSAQLDRFRALRQRRLKR